jgi:hypothetical protein
LVISHTRGEQDFMENLWIRVKGISRKIFDRRAVSNVVSATILTGVVIALSLAVVGWSQSRSSDYNRELSETVDAETARLQEKLAFEYIFYSDSESSGNLTVFLLNCGTIDDIKIQTVYIYDSSNALIEVFQDPTLYYFESWYEIPGWALDRGDEGRLVLTISDEHADEILGFCNIKVVTVRGATFDSEFVA